MRGFVITGPSSCGKTTVIEHLKGVGYLTVPEMARCVLREGNLHPLRDPFLYQCEIARRQFVEEENIKNKAKVEEVVFLDRGFYDQLAFCRHFGIERPPEDVWNEIRYEGVFFLERLDSFETDGVRFEKDMNEALAISEMIEEEYKKRIPLFKVPLMPVVERVAYILSRV